MLYLIFNEGYLASSGPQLQRGDLAAEGIRLARLLAALVPEDGEAVGLLALMLLIDSRRAAHTRANGTLIALPRAEPRPLGPKTHRRRRRADHRQSCAAAAGPLPGAGGHRRRARRGPVGGRDGLAPNRSPYDLLAEIAPNSLAALGQAVAHAALQGPRAGLATLAVLDQDGRLIAHHRLHAVRGHFLELLGEDEVARSSYLTAAELTGSAAEKAYLTDRAQQLTVGGACCSDRR